MFWGFFWHFTFRIHVCAGCPQQHGCVSPEVGGDAEDHDQHGIVDVEAVGDEREHAHRAHDLKRERASQGVRMGHQRSFTLRPRAMATYRGVGRLLLLLVGDGRVHVDQTQKVQTQGRRQAAEQPAGEAHSFFFLTLKFFLIFFFSCTGAYFGPVA